MNHFQFNNAPGRTIGCESLEALYYIPFGVLPDRERIKCLRTVPLDCARKSFCGWPSANYLVLAEYEEGTIELGVCEYEEPDFKVPEDEAEDDSMEREATEYCAKSARSYGVSLLIMGVALGIALCIMGYHVYNGKTIWAAIIGTAVAIEAAVAINLLNTLRTKVHEYVWTFAEFCAKTRTISNKGLKIILNGISKL